ncbi:MAG: precorrin-6A reductase [Eubacteriales bacterium]
MIDVLLFGGTSEGRILANRLQQKGVSTLVCVATEYGENLLEPGGSLRVHTGRLTEEEISSLIALERPARVIDATHPYASQIRQNVISACQATETPYLRVLRDTCPLPLTDCNAFETMQELVSWLNTQPGIIFSMLGAKEAIPLTAVSNYASRVWLRVLPSIESLSACINAGFKAKQIICMQGPFSEEMNLAMLRTANANILITKESGITGGFPEKLSAAKQLGLHVAVLKRPAQKSGYPLQELLRRVEERTL